MPIIRANGKMRACGHVGLQFRVKDKVRVSVRDRIGVRVREGLSNLCRDRSAEKKPA